MSSLFPLQSQNSRYFSESLELHNKSQKTTHGYTLKTMLLTQDIWHSICAHLDECSQLAMLSQVDRCLHRWLGISLGGKETWLRLGLRITGYSSEQLPFTIQHQQFKRCMQLLICPWLSEPKQLPFELPSAQMGGDYVWRIKLSPLDSTTLHYEMRHMVYDLHASAMQPSDTTELQYAIPNMPSDALPTEYTGPLPAIREQHDRVLNLMLDVVKREGLFMHDCKVIHRFHLGDLTTFIKPFLIRFI